MHLPSRFARLPQGRFGLGTDAYGNAWAERRLLEAASDARSPIFRTFINAALLTGMRSGEITTLTWGQVDLVDRVITVGRVKTSTGTGRQIPINGALLQSLADHARWFSEEFGETKPSYYLFPFGKPRPNDPTRPTTTLKTAWTTLRKRAKVDCRLHDLRHTAATKMAEAGVSEGTMLSLMGHMSRAMLERYSHIRMQAKRTAVESLSTGYGRQNSSTVSTVSTTVKEKACHSVTVSDWLDW